jgi:hypothetical protein
MIIEDGQGKGRLAYVTDEGQQLVLSESQTESRHHSTVGEVFLINSGFITSNAVAVVFASIIFFKNTSTTKVLHIGFFSTWSEVAGKWNLISNSTSISNSTPTIAANMNISSSKVLDATIEYGSATSVTTGGTTIANWISPGPGFSAHNFAGAIILGPTDSFTLEMAPFASVAGEVSVIAEAWQVEESIPL